MSKILKTRIAQQCPCCFSEDLSSSPAILMPFISHRAFNWRPVVIDETWGLNSIKKGNAYLEEFGTKLIKNYYFKNHGQNVRKKVP